MTDRKAQPECKRHGLEWSPKPGGYYVVRCAHYLNRFVVEIRGDSRKPLFMDFVEDLPPNDPDLVSVEGHSPQTEAEADERWNELTTRMLAGLHPDSEQST